MDVERRRKKKLVGRARRMRKNPTYAESKLWSRLKGKSLDGLKFRRQHVLPPYILDYYCPSKTLAVEVDGPHHKETKEQDQQRTQVLAEEHGVRMLRFTSWRVLNEIEDVLEEILEACMDE
jgi:leucyl-tRNA synthetase